jgi:hypothetical protein
MQPQAKTSARILEEATFDASRYAEPLGKNRESLLSVFRGNAHEFEILRNGSQKPSCRVTFVIDHYINIIKIKS